MAIYVRHNFLAIKVLWGAGWGGDGIESLSIVVWCLNERQRSSTQCSATRERDREAGASGTNTRNKRQKIWKEELRTRGTDMDKLTSFKIQFYSAIACESWYSLTRLLLTFSHDRLLISIPNPSVWTFVWMSVSSRGWGGGWVMNIVFCENASVSPHKYKLKLSTAWTFHEEC